MRSRTFVAGVRIDRLTAKEALDRIFDLGRGNGRHLVVTPNVDHLVRLRTDETFRAAYACATVRLADGMPVVWMSHLGSAPLPGRVTGADLVEPVLERAEREDLSVFFLGPQAETIECALQRCATSFPRLRIAGAYSPPFGFEADPEASKACVDHVRSASPNILLVALGAPKQEVWVARNRDNLAFGVALCIGAGIDFFAGVRKRAPRLMTRIGAEWVWRLIHEPMRLAGRYGRCLLFLPGLIWVQLRHRWRSKGGWPNSSSAH